MKRRRSGPNLLIMLEATCGVCRLEVARMSMCIPAESFSGELHLQAVKGIYAQHLGECSGGKPADRRLRELVGKRR